MSLVDIIDSVSLTIDDDSFDGSYIDSLIQVGRGEIAGDIDLPSLLVSDIVTTTSVASSVALPATYSRNLFWASSARGRIGTPGRGYYDLMGFYDRHPVSRAGQIMEVCVQGNSLLYQCTADDTVSIKFYTDPSGSEPVELPAYLQKPLLHSYACKEIFNMIEDGIEGAKVNTNKYEQSFALAMSKLMLWSDKQRPREPKIMAESRNDLSFW